MKLAIVAIVMAFALAGCGGGEIGDTGSSVAGIVTAKIAPEGSHEECTLVSAVPAVQQCHEAGNTDYMIVLEPLPGEKYSASKWYAAVAKVCLAPTEWRTLKIGDRWSSGHGYSDLWCDG